LKGKNNNELQGNRSETAIVTIDNNYLVFNLLNKSFFGKKPLRLDLGNSITAVAVNHFEGKRFL
jgi:hypothetical protein